MNELFSTRAIITQLPHALEFPRQAPAHLHYAAQFRDETLDSYIPFDWKQLSGGPLIYASLGTVRNTSKEAFQIIASACAGFKMQLVLSLGGGRLLPSDLGPLPGNPVVCHYVPQRSLLKRAALAINCAGLNTSLECIRNGVPMVTIPVGEDQPGVAARVANAEVGVILPRPKLSIRSLEEAIQHVLDESKYRSSADFLKQQLQQIDGVKTAVDLIERVV